MGRDRDHGIVNAQGSISKQCLTEKTRALERLHIETPRGRRGVREDNRSIVDRQRGTITSKKRGIVRGGLEREEPFWKRPPQQAA